MKRLKLLYVRVLENLYLRSIQTRQIGGTGPDDGGHMRLRIGCNFKKGDNRPVFIVIMDHSKVEWWKTRMVASPRQMELFSQHLEEMLSDQQESFRWTKTPEYDTRYIRVPEE